MCNSSLRWWCNWWSLGDTCNLLFLHHHLCDWLIRWIWFRQKKKRTVADLPLRFFNYLILAFSLGTRFEIFPLLFNSLWNLFPFFSKLAFKIFSNRNRDLFYTFSQTLKMFSSRNKDLFRKKKAIDTIIVISITTLF